ncbi:RNA methyltransferase [Nesterenkonia sp. Hz 6-5]|nr:RNA methyltransferase [Nesterenkonia haasae]
MDQPNRQHDDATGLDAHHASAAEAPEREVGVGPWDGPWPDSAHLDPTFLREGDRRNVIDSYRYWRHGAIVADLDSKRHGFHVAIENWQHDFNIGTVVRTANAFLAKEVHIIGKKRWNRRGAMVTDKYQHIRHHPTVEEFVSWAEAAGVVVLGVDLFPDSVPLETYPLPERCVLVFGQEGPGLSEPIREAAHATLSIAQFGSTRSINAGVAAGIAMHSWVRQHAAPQ